VSRGQKRALLAVAGLVAIIGIVFTAASFLASSSNAGNSVSAAPDYAAPDVPKSAVSQVDGADAPTGLPGLVIAGGNYRVYADSTDSGNPASGIDTLAADLTNVTTGASSVALTACSTDCTVDGHLYAYVSATQKADSPLSDGTKPYSIKATDKDANSRTVTGFNAIVDTTGPKFSALTIAVSSGGTPVGAPAGAVKASGTYLVYGNIADAGVGVDPSTPTADVSTLTTGATSVALQACTANCTVGGKTYDFVSTAEQTADAGLIASTKSITGSSKDKAGNAGGPDSFNVIVDNDAPNTPTTTIAPTSSGVPNSAAEGFVKSGSTYRVYSTTPTDKSGGATNAVSSGISRVTADTSNIQAGSSSLPMTTCTSNCVVGGKTYTLVTAEQTADKPLTEGQVTYGVTTFDNANLSSLKSSNVVIDNSAPTTTAATVSPVSGGVPTAAVGGFVKQGTTYRVYSNTLDPKSGGKNGSGVGSVSADLSSLTSGATNVPLTVCSSNCTVGGTTYAYSSADQTANSILADGSTQPYSISAADNLANAAAPAPFNATVDNTAPVVSASAIGGTVSGTPTGGAGFVHQGGTYKVFANLTDTGSGTASASADVSNVTTGASAVGLTPCSSNCTVGGVLYQLVSAEKTADNPLSGTKSYSVSGTDNAGNAGSAASFSVDVDNAAPTVDATAISTVSGGNPTGAPNVLKNGATFRVYANASDTGGSNIASVTASIANLSKTTSATLTFDATGVTVGGTTYHYISGDLTALNSSGPQGYTVTAADGAANTGSLGGSATFDNTAPTMTSVISSTSGGVPTVAGFVKKGGTYQVYANADDSTGSGTATVTASVTNITAAAGTLTLSPCTSNCTINGTPYAYVSSEQTADSGATPTDGSKNYTVTGVDNAGNSSGAKTFTVIADSTAPNTLTLTNPASNGALTGNSATLTGTAADSGVGLDASTVKLQVSPAGAGTFTDIASCTPMTAGTPPAFSCSFDTTTLTDGNKYDFQIFAADKLGNSKTVPSNNVVIDNSDPLVTMTDPGSPLKGDVVLAATASDGGSGIANVAFEYKLSVNSTWTSCGAADTTAPYTCTFKSGSFVDGKYDFRAIATDKVGRKTTSTAVTNRLVSNDTPLGSITFTVANGTGTKGIADSGDVITYVYTEEMDPNTILAGWDGTSKAVTAQVTESGTTADTFTVDSTNLGTINLKQNYVGTAPSVSPLVFNATIVGAVQSNGTYKVTVTLDLLTSGTAPTTAQATTSKAEWTTTTSTKDLGGTATAATKFAQGTAVVQF
jgi:hypothetical protein